MQPFEPEQLPPNELDFSELISLISKANRAIATFEGTFYAAPNQALLLSPLTTQEAVLSSKIEGTQANLTDVLKFDADGSASDRSKEQDIHEIKNYR